jgi:hypothetical protein
MRIAGTPRTVRIGGVEFSVPADANFKINLSTFKSEVIATTGDNMRKMTKQPASIMGCPIIGDVHEMGFLAALAESPNDTQMSVTLADGSTYSATGFINMNEIESSDYKCLVDMFPRAKWVSLLV